jgi:thiamine biosynthesis lipoprotein
MGVEAGIYLIEQLPGTHCLVVNDQNKIFTSKHIKLITFNG